MTTTPEPTIAPERKRAIALALYRLLNGRGKDFKAFDGDSEESQVYFEVIAKIDRSALHSFNDIRAMPPGLGRELSQEDKGKIAYAVLKFEMAYNELNLHERTEMVLAEFAKLIDIEPAEFEIFVNAMQAEVAKEMLAMPTLA